MTLSHYQLLEKKEFIQIKDTPDICLTEILEYLPTIQGFQYRGQKYSREKLENLMITRKLDLKNTNWDCLDYARWITSPQKVIFLDICWLPLKDVSILKEYSCLKCLEMRYKDENAFILEYILDELCNLSLDWLHIRSCTGQLCEMVYSRFCSGTLSVKKVYVDTPNYSQAHLTMHRLNQLVETPSSFYPSVCSSEEKAKTLYNDSHKNLEMLISVFELEANEHGMLGLSGKNAQATFWNGMSLAACVQSIDSIDEDKEAYHVCNRLAPYITQDKSELSVKFGGLYGLILSLHSNYMSAKFWLSNTYTNGVPYCSEAQMIEYGIRLYKTNIRCGEGGLDEFENRLAERMKRLSNYQDNWYYIWFQEIRCARILEIWKKMILPQRISHRFLHISMTAPPIFLKRAEATLLYLNLFIFKCYMRIAQKI